MIELRVSSVHAERKFDVMQAVGAKLMLMCSNTLADFVADQERAGLPNSMNLPGGPQNANRAWI